MIQAEAQKHIAERLAAEQVADQKLEKLKQDMLKCQEVCDHQQKMQKELMELKSENDHFKQKEAQLEQKVNQLEQDALNTKEVKERQQTELFEIKEELGQLKEELQELKLEKENMKLRGLEVDGKVNQLEENNTFLSKQLHDQLQKLEDERLKMKEERLKIKEKLMECNRDNLKTMGKVMEFNSDKWKMKEALEELKSKCEQLKLNAIQADVSDAVSELSSWVQVHQDAESSMLHSATSAFSVETNGARCFMLDSLFKTPRGTFVSGPHVRLGLNHDSKSLRI